MNRDALQKIHSKKFCYYFFLLFKVYYCKTKNDNACNDASIILKSHLKFTVTVNKNSKNKIGKYFKSQK